MKLRKQVIECLAAAACLVCAGCLTHKSVTALGNGYEEVTHTHHNFNFDSEPAPPRVSFQHRGPDDQVTEIWPSLSGSATVIQEDLVVFSAEKANLADHTTRPRLFAVRSADVPLDITDEVLWRWSRANGKDIRKTLDKFAEVQPSEGNGGLLVHIDFWPKTDYAARDDWPDDGSILLDWKQVAEIIQTVKTKGVLEKDQRWHTPYIGEQF
jgi:hypothetical protein